MSTADDVWGDSGSEDEGQHLDREWITRRDQFWNSGYREGLDQAKQELVQQGFDQGYKEGSEVGYHWGLVSGTVKTLGVLSDKLPQSSASQAQRVRELQEKVALPARDVLLACCEHIQADTPQPAEGAPEDATKLGRLRGEDVRNTIAVVSQALEGLGYALPQP